MSLVLKVHLRSDVNFDFILRKLHAFSSKAKPTSSCEFLHICRVAVLHEVNIDSQGITVIYIAIATLLKMSR